MRQVVHSILGRARPELIQREHFPYIVIENALPEEYYGKLAASFPSLQQVAGPRPLRNNKAYRRMARGVVDNPDFAPAWRAFFAWHSSAEFFRQAAAFWGADIRRCFPAFETRIGRSLADLNTGPRRDLQPVPGRDVQLDVQFVFNSPVAQESSVRGVHVDRGHKLFSAILYCRETGDDAGGDLLLYRPQPRDGHPREVEQIEKVGYAANTLVMWLNTPLSLHGVSMRRVTSRARRYVNFLAECPGLPGDGVHGLFPDPVPEPFQRIAPVARTDRERA
ncbi:MAG: 2OG-Fe(II) oxygenase [Gammaproteobacteria bacterium]|jgi:hypothetical protein|nr:2OG-Fe(II) oxygenase [Gammaproteobacteria bacterium]